MNTCGRRGSRTGQKGRLRPSQHRGFSWLYEKVWSWNDPSELPKAGSFTDCLRGTCSWARQLSSPRPPAGNTLSSWEDHFWRETLGMPSESTIDGHLESMWKSPGVADGSHCLWICFNHGVAIVVRDGFYFILKPLSQQVLNTCTHFDYEQEKENDPWMIWVELWWKVKVKSLSHVWLCDPMDCIAYQVSLSMGFSRQGYWNGLPFLSPGDLPNPGIEPTSLAL